MYKVGTEKDSFFYNGGGNSEKGIKKKSKLIRKCQGITPYLKNHWGYKKRNSQIFVKNS